MKERLDWPVASRIGHRHAPDDACARVRDRFTDEELTDLTLAIAPINGIDRMNVALGVEGGGCRPGNFNQRKAA